MLLVYNCVFLRKFVRQSHTDVTSFCMQFSAKKQLYTTVFVKTLSKPGLSAIYKNLSSEKFSDKHLKILHLPIFSENLRNFQTTYFGAAGWTDFWKLSSEYFDRNTIRKLIEIFRNLRIWSEFWEFFVGRTKPRVDTCRVRISKNYFALKIMFTNVLSKLFVKETSINDVTQVGWRGELCECIILDVCKIYFTTLNEVKFEWRQLMHVNIEFRLSWVRAPTLERQKYLYQKAEIRGKAWWGWGLIPSWVPHYFRGHTWCLVREAVGIGAHTWTHSDILCLN